MQVHNYEKLRVWQKSMDLAENIYILTNTFPKYELYGLSSQMRRAAVSIPSNIAEGSRRGTKKDFCNFLIIAMSSGSELETPVKIAKRLRYATIDGYREIDTSLAEVMGMLNRLIESNQ